MEKTYVISIDYKVLYNMYSIHDLRYIETHKLKIHMKYQQHSYAYAIFFRPKVLRNNLPNWPS